jgi:glyoxylase-like metal-dependent hydrolase (beta-lactamase superfamily II)
MAKSLVRRDRRALEMLKSWHMKGKLARVKRWFWILVSITAVVLVAKYLLLDTPAAPGAKYVIDLDSLHRAATASGALPDHLEVEQVGEFAFPAKLVVAGDSFHLHPMVLLSHRLVWPDHHSLIIDTAMSPAAAKALPGSKLDEAAFARVEAALKTADNIVFTHEHVDHVGGVASSPDFASIAKKVRITREQLNGPKLERKDFPAGALGQLEALDYEGLYTLAPGVVLQKAPGHSVGSQLIYVELANGTRFLFVGDIAWTHENITRQTGRPGIATLLMSEDRPAVAAQLQALAALPPDVHIIIAHDPVTLAKDLSAGLYRKGFSTQ